MATAFTSETYTSTSKKLEYFSDILTNLDVLPGKKDLARVTNEEAVKRSVRNLILTNTGERLFQPGIGANLNKVLFELADIDALDLAQDQIASTLRLHEPRAKLISVQATLLPDNNSLGLLINFSVINTGKQTSVNLILYRIR
jgi:phage baseplate assembly protein W